ncbi:MAG: diacylglycerol kinase [Campylobacterales bacterium]
MKPGYSLFKNGKYAVEGLWTGLKQESSFKLEVGLGVAEALLLLFLPLPLHWKGILLFSLFLLLAVELLNSAIERVVDLVSPQFHQLAKEAKDLGAGAVFLILVGHLLLWLVTALELINDLES